MTPEQMQKIVDGAPEGFNCWNTEMQSYTRGYIKLNGNIGLIDLRTELSKHDTLDLEPSDIPHGTIVLEK